ncbi:MAG: efflux RND transporter permease subunit [Porticoccaceae bacterium]
MKAVLDWFIKNPVAANLLMLVVVFGGLGSLGRLNNEFFPHVEPGMIQVTVPYPGAGPLEVEEQICIKIEEAIADVKGIKEVRSTASQSLGQVSIEMVDGWDLQRLINDVKTRVDAISTFPENTEKPIVSDLSRGREVVRLVAYGGHDEEAVKELALSLKDDLNRQPGVSEVEVSGIRDYQVTVEIAEATLRAYQLSFSDVATAIRNSSLNLPAGQMRNASGDIQIQVYGQDYRARDFADIAIIKSLDGAVVTLDDIATITDSFEEKNFLVEYEGKVAANLSVMVGEDPDTIGTAGDIRQFLEAYNQTLPPGYRVDVWSDRSYFLKDRLNILAESALQGLVLVFILLLLFLRPVLAAWVSAGIAVAYLGTLMLMPVTGTTVNVVSTFAFLLILGIVVDDAIVVSENIYSNYERNMPGPLAASQGVSTIAKPVILAVLTTLMVFVPMFFLPGNSADIFMPIPMVAIIALSFSLVESLFILPSHLSHLKPEKEHSNWLNSKITTARGYFTNGLNRFSFSVYQPLLEKSLRNRGATICFFLAVLMVCLSIFAAGWLPFRFMPKIQTEVMIAQAQLQEGAGFGRVLEIKEQIENGLIRLRQRDDAQTFSGESIVLDSFTRVDSNTVTVEVNLSGNSTRDLTTDDMQRLWREEIGEVKGVENFLISSSIFGLNKDISLRLSGKDLGELKEAADDVKAMLAEFNGVIEISDSLASARQEIRIDLKPLGESLGLDLADIASQVRHAFYGAEAQRIPRLREDVKVLVRYPADERANFENLTNMRIKLADGALVPFNEVAEASFVPGYTTISRTNRSRVVDVYANVIPGQANANAIVQAVMAKGQPLIAEKYASVTLELEGDHFDQVAFANALITGLIVALFAIYALLAVEFKSYLQPVYILSAVPFGIAGAIIGHIITGVEFSMPSSFGVLATAGVVVNSNLVLIDRINKLRDNGAAMLEAVKQGARQRLRPILLTSITTFFGLIPILLEESPSAAPLKPLVVSLAFGVVFATGITLLMVPALYMSFETLKERLGFAASAQVDLDALLEKQQVEKQLVEKQQEA